MVTGAVAGPFTMPGSAPDSGGAFCAQATPARIVSSARSHAVRLAETLARWDASVVVLDKEMELADE